MKNYMITQDEVNRDVFNSNENRISLDGSVSQFLNYYIAILGLAVSLGIISEDESENIFKIFFTAIKNKSSNKIVITNIMYIFSAWLQSKSQWEAFKELSTIKDLSTANILLEKSDNWLKGQIAMAKVSLLGLKKNIVSLENSQLINVYNKLFLFLNTLKKYETTEVCYKSEHSSMSFFLLVEYDFLGDDRKYTNPKKSIIKRISSMILDFSIEMRILCKMNGKNLISFADKEASKVFSSRVMKIEDINDRYKKKIECLKRNKEEELRLGEKKSSTIRNFYKKEIEKTYKAWDRAEKKYNQEVEKQNLSEGILDLMAEMPNLLLAMNEFTLYSLARKGKIQYPKTRIQKATVIENLSRITVVAEVLEYADSIGLSSNEIAYLKRIM